MHDRQLTDVLQMKWNGNSAEFKIMFCCLNLACDDRSCQTEGDGSESFAEPAEDKWMAGGAETPQRFINLLATCIYMHILMYSTCSCHCIENGSTACQRGSASLTYLHVLYTESSDLFYLTNTDVNWYFFFQMRKYFWWSRTGKKSWRTRSLNWKQTWRYKFNIIIQA